MARLTDDDFAALQEAFDRDTARALGSVRRAQGTATNAASRTWLTAGDNLAEKVIAALDQGDEDRALRLGRRIAALPVVDGTPTGPMAVSMLLHSEVVDPAFGEEARSGLLDAPLRLLPTLEPAVAALLRHVLASLTESGIPVAMERRIRAVTPLEVRLEPPFAGVPEAELPDAIVGALRLVLRLRSEE